MVATESERADSRTGVDARLLAGRRRVDELARRLETARAMGPAEIRERHVSRGKLLVRDRVERLLDPGAPLLELSPLAAQDHYGGDVPAAGVVAVIGRVHGRPVCVLANDGTVKGGTFYPLSVTKQLRAQRIALRHMLPCVYLVDSGGAFLPLQSEIFPDRTHGGRVFYNQARMSSRGIVQVAVVMGLCTAGGAYTPEMCDEVIIVRGSGAIFLGGPPLVRAATGEIVSPDELGGADVHTRLSGGADHLVTSEAEGIALAREVIARSGPFEWRADLLEPERVGALGNGRQAAWPDALLEILDTHENAPELPDSLLPSLVDEGRFDLFGDATPAARAPAGPSAHDDGGSGERQARRSGAGHAPGPGAGGARTSEPAGRTNAEGGPAPEGPVGGPRPARTGTVVAGLATIGGTRCGILAVAGRVDADGLARASGLAQACAASSRPLVVLALAPRIDESIAATRAAATLIGAIERIPLGHVVVELAAGDGLAREIFGGRATNPRFLFRWPYSATAGVDPFSASALVADDGVIDPAKTRGVLETVLALPVLADAKEFS